MKIILNITLLITSTVPGCRDVGADKLALSTLWTVD